MEKQVRKFDSDTLLIASHNPKKLEEFSGLLWGKVENFKSALDLGLDDVEETGTTFVENAKLKAVAMAKESGLTALADDSGFCVEALDGRPGVYSARYAINPETGERDFDYGIEKLHDELEACEDRKDDAAYFVCVLALAWPDGHVETFEGRANGRVVWPPRGERGFGYDPIFEPVGMDHTFAEISFVRKQKISHRAFALDKLIMACFE